MRVSDNDGTWKVQASLKDGQDMYNFRGDSVFEVSQALTDFHDIIELIHSTRQLLNAAGTVSAVMAAPVAAAPAAAPVQPAPVPAAAPAAAPAGPVCEHGEPAKYVAAGVSKSGPRAGQPYPAFYACARPRDTQCRFRANA